jgi:hypothetical protein
MEKATDLVSESLQMLHFSGWRCFGMGVTNVAEKGA